MHQCQTDPGTDGLARVPYGAENRVKANRQQEQDANSSAISPGLLAKRAQSKASKMYNNSSWDLVDVFEDGEVKLEELAVEQLPAEMQKMDKARQEEYVVGKARERKKVQEEIATLNKSRNDYVAKKQRETTKANVNTVNDAVTRAIRREAKNKNYVFEAQ